MDIKVYQLYFLLIWFTIKSEHQTLPGQIANSANSAVKWEEPGQCQKESKSFNPIWAQCLPCPEGLFAREGSPSECACPIGTVPAGEINDQIQCISCSDKDLAVGRNGAYCVQCLVSNGTRIQADQKTGKCPKSMCSSREIVQIAWMFNESNTTSAVEKCVNCPDGTWPNEDGSSCEQCAMSGGCHCKDNSSSLPIFCSEIPTTDFSIPLSHSSKEHDGQMESWFPSEAIQKNLVIIDHQCRLGNERQCQALANLCVLQDYRRQNLGGACNRMEQIRVNLKNSFQMLPQLFYANTEASLEIFRENAIDAVFEFGEEGRNTKLDIVGLLFLQNGTFIGEVPADKGFLQMCSPSLPKSHLGAFRKFGRFYKQKCRLSLDEIMRWNNLYKTKENIYGNFETIFIELYIRYEDTRRNVMLYQIPVFNGNVRSDQFGIFPNRIDELRRDSKIILTKRFFIVDLQKSKMDDSILVRVPRETSLQIQLQSNNDGHIYVPFMQISHDYYIVKMNENNFTNESSNKYIELEFNINYYMESYTYDKTIEVLMATICSISAIWAALQAYSWGRRSGKLIIDVSTIMKFILYGAECIGNVFMMVMGVTAIWLTYAYKFQTSIHYMLLSEYQETSFVAYLISATALKLLSLAHTILSLILVQTFFIDWERPRIMEYEQGFPAEDRARHSASQSIDNNKLDKRINGNSVVIWRTYLVANEWNELQLYRKTHIGLQLLLLLILLEYAELGNFAKAQPGFGIYSQPAEFIETRMSRFAINFSFYMGIALLQWLLQVVILERISDPFRNFMDLCSVANISVLAMTHPLRGFYIHGRSVHGFADTDMQQMNIFLQRERENLCAMRGLESGSDLQTFVVNMPHTFRERIDEILSGLNSKTINMGQQGKPFGTQQFASNSESDKTTMRVQLVANVYNQLNDFLKNFINRVEPNCEYAIVESRFIEELLGMDLIDSTKIGNFKRDVSETEYSSVFLYGNEWALLSFEMLCFCLFDLFWRNRVLAAFATYILSKATVQITKLYFTHQLARSSLVDSRFLI